MSTIALLPARAPIATPKNNGENTMTNHTIAVGCLIDSVGGLRQVGFATAASANLASSVATSAIASSAASLGLLCSGPLSMGFAATTTIPDACASLDKAKKELIQANASGFQNSPGVKSAEQMVTIRKLGVVSQCFLFAMGLIQTGCGVVYMLGSEAASAFHYSTVLSGAMAALASTITSVGLGAIYIFRGTVMIYRSYLAHSLVKSFQSEYQKLTSDSAKIQFMKVAEGRGQAYMQTYVHSSCLEKTLETGESCTMTSQGYQLKDGTIHPYLNDSQIEEYLQRVEKGIFSELLKPKLCAMIGVSMILGGVLTLALTVLTHGIAPIAISLASAIFFMLAENIFLSYDAPQLFDRLRDRLFGPIAMYELVRARESSVSILESYTV